MNPYEVLGVRRNANIASIKKAFRARVKTAHPDAGGSVDDFHRVHAAWRVLSDPERRRRYDHTGQMDELGADTREAVVLTVISWAFNAALEVLGKQGANLLQQDMVAIMRSCLEQRNSAAEDQSRRLEMNAVALGKLIGRFDREGDGPNLMEELVAARLIEIQRTSSNVTAEREVISAALEMLTDYRFRREMAMRVLHMMSSTTSSSTSAW